ncbi:MAG: replicative DNA helicase [Actinobacteria bacterium]|jgi:replicative DNA helicase|nr:replicative DNA helicase [Actinomycetota bacterium]
MVQTLAHSQHLPAKPLNGRVPPHNIEAEESLLGSMLLSRDAVAVALERCQAGDFYKPAHGYIFSAICSLYTKGEPVDPVTVAEELRRMGHAEILEDPSVLISLQASTPSISSASHYAGIVEERSLLRRLIVVASDIAEMGYEIPENVLEVVDRAESMIFEVASRRVIDSLKPITELLKESVETLERIQEAGHQITGVATGYTGLDEYLSGLQPSNLVVVGARPSMGKTSFALGALTHAAIRSKIPVLLFSLEMSHLELSQRIISSESQVDVKHLRSGHLSQSDWAKIWGAINKLDDAPIFIDDNPNLTVMDIRAKSRRLMSSNRGLGLIVVDYMQLMTGRHNAENRQVEVSEISRGLKILARELHVPVLALSQLSRNLEMRQDKRPMLADLRESGSIEQDADVVLFIYRDEIYNQDSPDRGTAEVIIAKHRNGPTGLVRLSFVDRYARFGNIATM